MNAEKTTNTDNQTKKRKPLEKVLNIVAIVFAVLILIVAIFTIASIGKGYTSFFGTAILGVETYSMEGDKEDNFTRGDLIFIKILSDEEKLELEVGDIVTFYDMVEGVRKLNTHRIIEKWEGLDGTQYYRTQGDNSPTIDTPLKAEGVIGVYTGQIKNIGHINLFLASSLGFFLVAVVPSILLVGYCVFRVVMSSLEYKKEKDGEMKELLREQLKAELLSNEASQPQEVAQAKEETQQEQI